MWEVAILTSFVTTLNRVYAAPGNIIQIGIEHSDNSVVPDDVTPVNTTCCGKRFLTTKAVQMSDPASIFLLLKMVDGLFEVSPAQFSISGACGQISQVHQIMKSQRFCTLADSEKKISSADQTLCCLLYTFCAERRTCRHGGDYSLSPAKGLEKALGQTFTILNWDTVCVIHDNNRNEDLNRLLHVLYIHQVLFIVRSVTSSTIGDCQYLNTNHSPRVVALLSNSTLKRDIDKVVDVHGNVQGWIVTSLWLFWSDQLHDFPLRETPFVHISVFGNSKRYLKNGAIYQILSVSGYTHNRRLELAVQWDSSFNAHRHRDVFPHQQFLLNNITLTVSTKEWPPFVVKKLLKSGRTIFTGFCIDMLKELSRRLNFSYVLVEPKDNEWGRIDNGKWTGIVGQVVNQEADILVAPISVQRERADVLDFTYPFFFDQKSFIVKQSGTGNHWADLINPFDVISLLIFVMSVPLTASILCLLERAGSFTEHINKPGSQTKFDKFTHCLLYLYGALLSEGGDDTCRSITARTVIAFWWLFSIVAGGIYTGNLVATRTTVRVDSAISTINDLLARTDYSWGVEQGDYLTMWLANSSAAKFSALWSGIERFNKTDPRVLSSNYSVHIENVNQGQYALFNDRSFLEIEVTKNCDELHLASENILPMSFAIGLQQNSTLTPLFSHEILAFHEAGIIAAWKGRWWPQSKCYRRKTNEARPVEYNEVRGAYYILGGSLFLAFMAFIMEATLYKLQDQCFRKFCKIGVTQETLKDAGQELTCNRITTTRCWEHPFNLQNSSAGDYGDVTSDR